MNRHEERNVIRATLLLNSLGFGTGNSIKEDIKQDLERICGGRPIYKCSKEISKFALELCQGIDDLQALEVSLRACKNLPEAYRPQAIQIAKKIIELDPSGYSYYQYGLLLLKDGQLQEAEKAFITAYKLNPSSDLICVHLAKTYVKLNMIDTGLELLYDFKRSPNYGRKYKNCLGEERIDETSITCIDSMISDLEGKKSRGYVYRPRKKRSSKSN